MSPHLIGTMDEEGSCQEHQPVAPSHPMQNQWRCATRHCGPACSSFVTSPEPQAATSQQEVLNNRPAATPQALGLTNGPTEQALPLATEPAVPQQKGQPSSNTNGQTLEELEAQAYQAIAFKKKTKGMKRPAAHQPTPTPKCKAKTVAKAKAASKAKAAPKAKKSGMGPGCSKCRGDGCSQCGKPNFRGQIYPGRAASKAAFGKRKRNHL